MLKSQCGYFCSDISQDVHYDLFLNRADSVKADQRTPPSTKGLTEFGKVNYRLTILQW